MKSSGTFNCMHLEHAHKSETLLRFLPQVVAFYCICSPFIVETGSQLHLEKGAMWTPGLRGPLLFYI